MNASAAPDFQPRQLVELAKDLASEFPWLPQALAACEGGQWDSPAYLRFVFSEDSNQSGAEWQFLANVVLEHEHHGTVVVDVLKGNRIGGIELLDRIED